MSTGGSDYVVQGVHAWTRNTTLAFRDALVGEIDSMVGGANFRGPYPEMRPAAFNREGAMLIAYMDYNRERPLSSTELERVFDLAGAGDFEGVSVHVSDQGISSVEFGGV